MASPNSARRARRTAGARSAMRHLPHAAARLEAAHGGGARAAARRRCALALLYGIARGVEGHSNVTVGGDNVVRGPAVAAASLVDLQLERRGAGVLPALDLRARRLQLRVPEAILGAILHPELHLLRSLRQPELMARDRGYE